MPLLALLGVILIILAVLHYIPLALGLILGGVLLVAGGGAILGPWNR